MKTARTISVSLFIAFMFAGFWLGKAAGQAGLKKINHLLSTAAQQTKAGADERALHSLDGSGTGSGSLYPLPAYLMESEAHPLPDVPEFPLPAEPEIREEVSAETVPAYPLPAEEPFTSVPREGSPGALDTITGQRNLLVIGVNEIGSSDLTLEGIWLVLYRQDTPHFTLMPVYPEPGSNPDHQAYEALIGLFSLDSFGNPGESFLEALYAKELWWNYFIVVDQTAMAGMIDFVGGVTLGNTMMDGIHAIANMPNVALASQDALRAQAEVIKDICSHSSGPELSARVEALLRLVPDHLSTDMDLEQALIQWERLRAAGPFTCEFPSLWPIH